MHPQTSHNLLRNSTPGMVWEFVIGRTNSHGVIINKNNIEKTLWCYSEHDLIRLKAPISVYMQMQRLCDKR